MAFTPNQRVRLLGGPDDRGVTFMPRSPTRSPPSSGKPAKIHPLPGRTAFSFKGLKAIEVPEERIRPALNAIQRNLLPRDTLRYNRLPELSNILN
jgi:hypothetical protein